MCGVMPVTTWTRRERFKVVGVHVVVGSGTLAHVVSLVAIIVTVIDHKVLVTRDWSRHVRGDKLEITVYNKEIWVEPAISLLPNWPDPDCPGPEGRSHNTNWRLQITISI